MVRAAADVRRAEQRLAQINNYSLAKLVRSAVWAKHMPSYQRFFGEDSGAWSKSDHREMSDEAMYAVVRGLNKAFGGKED
jgi:hypothetical protein